MIEEINKYKRVEKTVRTTTYPVADLVIEKFFNKRIKVSVILSNGNCYIHVRIYS